MFVMYREPSIIKKSKDGRVAAVDMASELLNSRVLLLEGEVNDVTCNGLIKSMLVLEHQSAAEPITLIINSPGGSVTAGAGAHRHHAVARLPRDHGGRGRRGLDGRGNPGLRRSPPGVPPHAGAHSPANGRHRHGAADRYRDCGPAYGSHACELDELLAEHGNLSAQEFHELTERDCWCNAKRALELGLVDEVIAPSKKAL